MIKVLGFGGVILTVISQLLLKLASRKYHGQGVIKYYINYLTICGYAGLLVVTLINLFVLRILEMYYIVVFLASSLVLIGVASKLFLKESIDKSTALSYMIITIGIIIYAL